MRNKMKYKPKINFSFYSEETEEGYVDCFIIVEHYVNVKPDPYTWDSDWDYYGYEEIDYTLVDEENNELNLDIDESVDEEIKNKIREYFEDESP
jgi:hypothetical protein